MKFWGQSLPELFMTGSFAMWPLLLCSVIGVAVILERTSYFFRIRLHYPKYRAELIGLLQCGKTTEARKLNRKSVNPVPRMADLYMVNLHHDTLRQEILSREGSLALEKMESRLRTLAAITHIAPLLGLLGTVTGLVGAFHQIELLGGHVQPSDLAGGIWEALITTVFGLVIAIPCMAAYHAFESVADNTARRMKFIVSDLDEFYGKLPQNFQNRQNPVDAQEENAGGIY